MSGQQPMRAGAANGIDYAGGGGPPASQPNTTRTTPDSGLGNDDRNGERNRQVPPGFQVQPAPYHHYGQQQLRVNFQANPNDSMYAPKREQPPRMDYQNVPYHQRYGEMTGNQGNLQSRVPPLPRGPQTMPSNSYDESGNQFHMSNNSAMNTGPGLMGGAPLHMMPPHGTSGMVGYPTQHYDLRYGTTGSAISSPAVVPAFESEQPPPPQTPQQNFHPSPPGNQQVPQGTTYYTNPFQTSMNQGPGNYHQPLMYEQQQNMYASAPEHVMMSHQPHMMMAHQQYQQQGGMVLVPPQGYPTYVPSDHRAIYTQSQAMHRNNLATSQVPHEGYQAPMHSVPQHNIRMGQPVYPQQFIMQHGAMQDGGMVYPPYLTYQQSPMPLSTYAPQVVPAQRGGRNFRGGRGGFSNGGNRWQRPYSRQSGNSTSNSENRVPSAGSQEAETLPEKLQQLDITIPNDSDLQSMVSPTKLKKDSPKQILELAESRQASAVAVVESSNNVSFPQQAGIKTEIKVESVKDVNVQKVADKKPIVTAPVKNLPTAECHYCKVHKQEDYFHLFSDKNGRVICEYARTTMECKKCGNVGGDNAHSTLLCKKDKEKLHTAPKPSLNESALKQRPSDDVRSGHDARGHKDVKVTQDATPPRSSHSDGHGNRGRGRGGNRGNRGQTRGGFFPGGRGSRRGDNK